MERLCYVAAGEVGIDPATHTLRQLLWMMHARRSERWDHTAEIVYTLTCVNADPKAKPPKRSEFHPYIGGETGEEVKRIRMDPTTGVNALAAIMGAQNSGS